MLTDSDQSSRTGADEGIVVADRRSTTTSFVGHGRLYTQVLGPEDRVPVGVAGKTAIDNKAG